ncbi:MAG: AAC(3)-I family aminoglycoside N-acetyltransferase [Rhizobiales bacterium]|nr:AAC(3)-I family aminoglycoside N-acetyltransferase [Hyphomicrobiales bacterium]
MPISIRQLNADDLEAMDALLAVFGDAFEDTETYGRARPHPDYMRRLLGSSDFIALTAMVEGEVVGGLTAYVLHKFEQERSEVYVYDLAVLSAHRRQGIATALIGELRNIAKAYGAWLVFIQADHGDDPAIALYTKLGTREDVLHFDIPVD